ncbi:MAG: hypothetical protein EOP49_05625, partial [Sphingobacteriales bacterium]
MGKIISVMVAFIVSHSWSMEAQPVHIDSVLKPGAVFINSYKQLFYPCSACTITVKGAVSYTLGVVTVINGLTYRHLCKQSKGRIIDNWNYTLNHAEEGASSLSRIGFIRIKEDSVFFTNTGYPPVNNNTIFN